MAKFRDRFGMGRSAIVPKQSGETYLQRHARRFDVNIAHEDDVRAWCFDRAVTGTISNGGHHWRFMYGQKVAEWWPSTAKLVFQKVYHQGIHCHDYAQVMTALSKRWKLDHRILNDVRGSAK